MTQTTLRLAGAVPETETQWRAESMQLVNWGGFDGHVPVDLSVSGATLLTGSSGTGKSTLLDSYLALMMPSNTPFNGASNDHTVGRARGSDQRSLLTYLRGKVADQRDDGGETVHKVLRGTTSLTWGAVAATFVNDNGNHYTALRVYSAPRAATRSSGVQQRMATVEARFNVRQLEALGGDLDKRGMRARFPALNLHDTYDAFAAALHARLGIGANGDGTKALRLLARIQGGQQIRTVNDLYKQMVLETPVTYEAADLAIEHFRDLNSSYEKMLTEHGKHEVLTPLPGLREEVVDAQKRLRRHAGFGSTTGEDSSFKLWRLTTLDRMLTDDCDANRTEYVAAKAGLAAARNLESDLLTRLADVREQQRANGGETLERLAAELEGLRLTLSATTDRRTAFDRNVGQVGLSMATREEFAAAQQEAERFFATLEATERAVEDELEHLRNTRRPLLDEHRLLREERDSLSKRDGLMPKRLHDIRTVMASAAGFDVADLPFAAELMDVAPGEERWRTAAEVTLGGIARTILVDQRHLDRLSTAIDPLALPERINFKGVVLRDNSSGPLDPEFVSGKLLFKDSPFAAALRETVSSRGVDHRCVGGPAQLAGEGPRVTAAGQTRRGTMGAHGRSRRENVIGFSNTDRLAEIDAELDRLESAIDDLDVAITRCEQRRRTLRQQSSAFQTIQQTDWSQIDVAGVEARIAAAESKRDEVVATSDILQALKTEEEQLECDREIAAADRVRASDTRDGLDEAYGRLVDRQDTVVDDLQRIERSGAATLTDEQDGHLTSLLAAEGTPGDLDSFDRDIDKVRRNLDADAHRAEDDLDRATASMTRIFEAYQRSWPDPNLGTSVAAYDDYSEILDRIVASGLAERRHEWQRRLSEWSGQDLVPLAGAFDRSVEEIQGRLLPVNEILRTLPFGAGRNRLYIDMRRIHRDHVMEFRRELRYLASGVTEEQSQKQLEERFERLRVFMARITSPTGGGRSERDDLLDVRRYIEITAVELDADDNEVAVYSTLGEKSGGETQELIAFIVGAALRFQLGDESRTRPRFAPVFLDEGFIKADSEFAGRSVAAWKGLGFQLIVGAPLDKVTALEPYTDLILEVTKSSGGYASVTPIKAEGQ